MALVAALALSAATAPQAVGQSSVTVAIDVDAAGNTARTVGSVQNCIRIGSGDTEEIDIVLPSPGIPSDVGIKGWQFDLRYEESVLTVTGHDPELLLAQASGSSLFTGLTDPLPDSDGIFTSAGADFGQAFQTEPQGVQEVGPGVIARITLSAVSQGSTNLSLGNVLLADAQNNSIPIGKLLGATVAVDVPCTPPPSPTALPGADGATGGDGQTPLPGTPGAGPDAGATPGSGQTGGSQTPGVATPGPNTPVLGGTPLSDGDSEDSDDGGLSTGAWVGIGVGIAAGVLAASGAGWYALRRRRTGGG